MAIKENERTMYHNMLSAIHSVLNNTTVETNLFGCSIIFSEIWKELTNEELNIQDSILNDDEGHWVVDVIYNDKKYRASGAETYNTFSFSLILK